MSSDNKGVFKRRRLKQFNILGCIFIMNIIFISRFCTYMNWICIYIQIWLIVCAFLLCDFWHLQVIIAIKTNYSSEVLFNTKILILINSSGVPCCMTLKKNTWFNLYRNCCTRNLINKPKKIHSCSLNEAEKGPVLYHAMQEIYYPSLIDRWHFLK